MVTNVTCPTCQYRFTVPEGAMGKRQTCPNCHSPMVAGKSEAPGGAEPVASMLQGQQPVVPAAKVGLNKTMLGEAAPPIRFNCPRCKGVLEVPAGDVGQKMPCTHCGQRLQVPNPTVPPPPANKTMLGQDLAAPAVPVLVQPEPPARTERCLECARDVTGWDRVFNCPDCGSIFCSSLCIREHRAHAHQGRPRRRPPERPHEELEPDYTGLIVGLILGGLFLLFMLIFLFVAILG